jgi:ABC-2 type transport system permease protein
VTALLAAEVRKLWTVRTTWILTVFGLGLVGLTTGTLVFSELVVGPFTGAEEQVAAAVDQIGSNAIIVLVVALLAMTTEFRHGTIGRTLQLTPGRALVLGAKLAVGVVYAAAFFVASAAIVATLLFAATITDGVSLQLGGEVGRSVWQGLVGLALNGVFGVAVGALIRSQVVAITIVLVWLFVVENLFAALWPGIGRWLPFQALNALFLSDEVLTNVPEGMATPLEPSLALATFLGYVVLATVTAGLLLRHRDV